MDNITIACIQTHLIWENSDANLEKFAKYFEQIKKADIVVLPEMFNTGFSMNVKELAQKLNGEAVKWLKTMAGQHNFAIMGSLIINDANNYYNRLLMVTPNGEIEWYDKRHLFRMGNEHKNYSAGSRMPIFSHLGWRIRPLICYDLRFPVWSRNQNNYDLLIYVANWPAARREVWLTLLKARAIENQCYVVGVNRVGTDGMGIEYSGHSMVINPRGNVVSELAENAEGIVVSTLSLNDLHQFREKFPVHFDADDFRINGID